jgi:hypothetical protein
VVSRRFKIPEEKLDGLPATQVGHSNLNEGIMQNTFQGNLLTFQQAEAGLLDPQKLSSANGIESTELSNSKLGTNVSSKERTSFEAACSEAVNKKGLLPRGQNLDSPSSSSEEKNTDPKKTVGTGGANDADETNPAATAISENFSLKLYRMLEEAETEGDDEIVSFLPDGRSFAIHKPKQFESEIMPKYFTTSRMSSFQRQLNLYGFRRITDGREKGGYFHESFVKGKKMQCKKIKRKKSTVKSNQSLLGLGGMQTGTVNPYEQQGLIVQQALAAERGRLDPSLNHGQTLPGLFMNGMLDSASWPGTSHASATNQAMAALLSQQQLQEQTTVNQLLFQQLQQRQLMDELERRDIQRPSTNPGTYRNQELLIQQALAETSRLESTLNLTHIRQSAASNNGMLSSSASGWSSVMPSVDTTTSEPTGNQSMAALLDLQQQQQQQQVMPTQRMLQQLHLIRRELLLQDQNKRF